ncbi:hypothetical protein IAG44_35650 [Streptomyces roseirectus]|uniref:Secreted protein n=1 Tax=Streptomyces roseirectus TaxID=2768066 RepID=A0A7H0INA2_9ACTN|nr:hypothetical protein [Streptomyces roseirectus]QNP74268.1 hypothetical protein IAG44_35650 [Streptomyces roseirectus]
MSAVLPYLILLAGGAISAALVSHEEAFRTTSYSARIEMTTESDRTALIPTPDRWRVRWGRGRRRRSPGRGGASRSGRGKIFGESVVASGRERRLMCGRVTPGSVVR